MNPKIGGLIGAVFFAGAVAAVVVKDGQSVDEPVKTSTTVVLDGKAPQDETKLSTSLQTSVRATKLSDGGLAYYTIEQDGGIIRVSKSPCAWKPTPAAQCFRPDGGNPGVKNTMQPGQFVGSGCVRKSCVIYGGEPDSDEDR